MNIRDLVESDLNGVLTLILADHLPSQPIYTIQDLQNALTGHATTDRGWWDALTAVRTIVATIGDTVVGAASYGIRKQDDSPFADCGFILWLHAREDQEVTEALLSSLLTSLNNLPTHLCFLDSYSPHLRCRGSTSRASSRNARYPSASRFQRTR